jgi:hypothetical protein
MYCVGREANHPADNNGNNMTPTHPALLALWNLGPKATAATRDAAAPVGRNPEATRLAAARRRLYWANREIARMTPAA